MKIVWGLYIYSVLNGIGFESSHSITSLDTYFISKKECINSARLMNSGSAKDREIGLDPGIKIRYICLAASLKKYIKKANKKNLRPLDKVEAQRKSKIGIFVVPEIIAINL